MKKSTTANPTGAGAEGARPAVQAVFTDQAPRPVGPYSQALLWKGPGRLLICSGQIGLSPDEKDFSALSVEGQAEQIFKNLHAVLQAAGMDWRHVIKTSVFLKSMKDFQAFNAIYSSYFNQEPLPARSCIEASALPKNALAEMEAWACKP